MGGVVDAVKDVVDDVLDFATDTIDDVYEFQKDVIGGAQDVVEGAIDITIDVGRDVLEFAVDVTDAATEVFLDYVDFTTLGIAKPLTDFVRDFNDGLSYLTKVAINGDWKAVAQLGMMVVAVWLALPTGGLSLTWASAAMWASFTYTVYGIAVSLVEIGKMLGTGAASLPYVLQQIRDSMNLEFINSWINGAMNRWMAGGVLYDAPRAGDVLFNPTGTQNTTKFLGLQDTNSNFYTQVSTLGLFHTPHRLKFGAKAGDEGFSVSSLVKG
jgi:hypothetical protein